MEKKIYIEGMMCENCKKHIEKAIDAIDGVSNYDVNLQTKCASITTSKDIRDSVFAKAIEDAGYSVTKIE